MPRKSLVGAIGFSPRPGQIPLKKGEADALKSLLRRLFFPAAGQEKNQKYRQQRPP